METTNCCSVADMAAIMNGNNQGMNWNSPMWLIWAMLFGNGGFGGWGNRGGEAAAMAGTAEINSRINALQTSINENQQTNTLGAGIMSNGDKLMGVGGRMDLGFAGVTSAINQASTANLMAQKDQSAQMASCCCDIKTNILSQTNQLQSQIAQLANGVQTGFANLGFLTQQQTNELNAAASANTQRILDKMCNDTTQSLRDKLAEASQQAQTSYLISQLKTAS